MTDNKLLDAFRYHRFGGSIAVAALERAREDVAAGKSRYPRTRQHGSQIGAAMKNGLQWANPDQIGLRFVGWQDEVRDLSARDAHRGWYTRSDDCGGEVLRGCVYQLVAKDGKARFLPAYREGTSDRKGWSDTCGEHNAAIHFGDVFSYGDADDAKRDAARAADHFAEHSAEESREYNDAWQAGSDYAALGAEVKEHRQNALALLREIKSHGAFPPAICATLRAHVLSCINDIASLRRRRAELTRDIWRDYYAAFNDGAGENVLA